MDAQQRQELLLRGDRSAGPLVLLPLSREAAVLGDSLRERRRLEDDEHPLADGDRRSRPADQSLPRRGLGAERPLVRRADAEAEHEERCRRDDDRRRRDLPRLRDSGHRHPAQDNAGTGLPRRSARPRRSSRRCRCRARAGARPRRATRRAARSSLRLRRRLLSVRPRCARPP